ncbi:MAG TPA: hypothetical protein VFA43_24675 [Gemmatimonadaceae bacterium]|nr:hypothetical protein [Gemmatimonadaceae bacterium]
MSVRNVCAVAWVLAAVACGSPSSPHNSGGPQPGVRFLAGNLQSDSILSVPNQALVVQISSHGTVAAGQIVQFEAINASDSAHPNFPDWVDVAPLTSNQPASFVAETTNTQGIVTVDVFFGVRAGTAPLLIKVPQLGYVDTAKFNITAGNPAGLHSGPADTSVYVNGTVQLHTAVVDRYGNPRTDPVTYALLSGPGQLSGSTVTVTGVGRVSVSGTAQGLPHTPPAVDTTLITGVPQGTMAASIDAGGVATFNLDGSHYQVITTTVAGTVAWNPLGSSLVFDQTSGGGTFGGADLLYGVTTAGQTSVLDNSGGSIDAWPAYSHDGMWIYYTKITNSPDIWRVHPDGTGDAIVMQTGSNPSQFPSPSPDGTSLVYVVPGGAQVEILNLSTGVSTELGTILANATAWSPTGTLIAWNANGQISVIKPDGTGNTVLTAPNYEFQMGWSPDGNWIAARNLTTRKIDLINVANPQIILPLGYTGSLGSPSWH